MKRLLLIHLLVFLSVSIYESDNFSDNVQDYNYLEHVIWTEQESAGNVLSDLKRSKTLKLSAGHFVLLDGYPSRIDPPDGQIKILFYQDEARPDKTWQKQNNNNQKKLKRLQT